MYFIQSNSDSVLVNVCRSLKDSIVVIRFQGFYYAILFGHQKVKMESFVKTKVTCCLPA